MNAARLAWRMLMRDWRAGELHLFFIALAVAVAALTSVGFLTDRVQRALEREAHGLLGGDLLLTADHPWSDAFRQAARAHGLQIAESATLLSMVASGDATQLVEVKAVSATYPLRGHWRVRDAAKSGAGETASAPAPGLVWPDERLTDALGLSPGDPLRLGELVANVGAVVTFEPELGFNPLALAPRVIIHWDDLDRTRLLQPGSRVSWRLHVAGEAAAVERYRWWAKSRLGRGEKLEGLDNARPEVRQIIERAQGFLRLAALLTVVLAAVAVGVSGRRYLHRHYDACAVMRCLGASERQLLLILGGEFILLGGAAILVGGAAGFLLQDWFRVLLSGLLPAELPTPGYMPWWHGLTVGAVLLAGFIFPPLLRLKSVSTVRVLRREWQATEPLSLFAYLSGLAGLAGLVYWMAGDARLASFVGLGFLLAVTMFALLGRVLLRLIAHAGTRLCSGNWRLGLARLGRPASGHWVQVVALSLGLSTMLLLLLARNDLLPAWQARMPADAPNRFVINIQSDQRPAIAEFFASADLPVPRVEPMVRARLVRINDTEAAARDYTDERARRWIEREFNLSSRDDLPPGNALVGGQWHENGGAMQFSVEQGLAEALKLKLADVLEFDIAGQRISGRVTSLRKLDWDSMRVNFFVITPAGRLDGYPTSHITSFYLPEASAGVARELTRRFPNLTIIDVAALMRQIQTMLNQAIGVVQLVFGLTVVAGLVVLQATLEAGRGERYHELAVMRALGGRRTQLGQVVMVEFVMLGAVAGLLSGVAALAIGTALARGVFHLEYWPATGILWLGLLAGVLGVGLTSVGLIRHAFSRSVMEGLRTA